MLQCRQTPNTSSVLGNTVTSMAGPRSHIHFDAIQPTPSRRMLEEAYSIVERQVTWLSRDCKRRGDVASYDRKSHWRVSIVYPQPRVPSEFASWPRSAALPPCSFTRVADMHLD